MPPTTSHTVAPQSTSHLSATAAIGTSAHQDVSEAGTVDGSLPPVFELAVHEDAAARVIHGLPEREEDRPAHDDRFDRRSVERNGDYDDLGS